MIRVKRYEKLKRFAVHMAKDEAEGLERDIAKAKEANLETPYFEALDEIIKEWKADQP